MDPVSPKKCSWCLSKRGWRILRVTLVCLVAIPSNGIGEGNGPVWALEPVQAQPGYVYSFPKDHGVHEEFSLEWWYFTGHLHAATGRRFGYEVTFFRKTVEDPSLDLHPSQWAIRQLYLAHFAVTDVENGAFRYAEKLSRAALGKAGAEMGGMTVWLDRWSVKPGDRDHHTLQLRAEARAMSLDLELTSHKPPVIHGENGVSRKGAGVGQASHYYSLTRLGTKGRLTVNGESFTVTGLSWMDHEFGSGMLGPDQVGWDWMSLQLDGEVEVMVYMLRRRDGSPDPVSSGTLVLRDGSTRHLNLQDIILVPQSQWQSPNSGARYPSSWSLTIPSVQLSLRIQPVQDNQELQTSKSTQVTYWEGAVDVKGTSQGAPLRGVGYVELTGYAESLDLQGR